MSTARAIAMTWLGLSLLAALPGLEAIGRALTQPESRDLVWLSAGALGVLFWRARSSLRVERLRPSGIALPLFGALVCLCIARWLDVRWVFEFVSLCVPLLVCRGFLGPEGRARLTQAWMVLAFALPMPGLLVEAFAIPLQHFEAAALESLALLLGHDVTLTGTVLNVEGRVLEVAQSCSGWNLMGPLLLFSYVAGVMTGGPIWVRIAAAGLVLALSQLLNLGRMLVVLVLHVHASAETAGWVHDMLGWVLMMAAGALPFVWLSPAEDRLSTSESNLLGATRVHSTTAAVLLLLCALAPALVEHWLRQGSEETPDLAAVPLQVESWVAVDEPMPAREREILAADVLLHRRYLDVRGQGELLLMAAWHREARAAEGHDARNCYAVRSWVLASERPLPLAGFAAPATLYRFDDRSGRMLSVLEASVRTDRGGLLRVLLVSDRADTLTSEVGVALLAHARTRLERVAS